MQTCRSATGLRDRTVAAVVVLGAVAAIFSPSQAFAAAALSWSAPATISSATLTAIACPSRGLCVAVDEAGRVFASTAPTSGGSSSWTRVDSDSSGLTSVACASPALCAAVDRSGRAIVSTTPASAGSWTAPRSIDGTAALDAISCPSQSLCVAGDGLGNAFTSVDPASSDQPWTAAAIDPGKALESVSCPSEQLCVAVDSSGTALASVQPAGGASAWHKRYVDSTRLLDVSCDSANACVALDGSGNAFASADPTSSTPTWSSTSIDPAAGGGTGVPAGVSCTSSRLCVAVDGSEAVPTSDDPTEAVPTWSVSHAGVALDRVSCTPEGFCAAVSGGRVLSASLPAPAAMTSAPAEVGQTTATLVGTVNPNDALLSDCRFEYGPTPAYGESARCSPLGLLGSGPRAVTASLASLAPGTLYHYRVVALSGAGEGVGADQTFTTVTATLAHPHPTISGVPAVGSRLQCNPGVPASEAIALAYEWRRDGGPIAGAHGSVYRVARADATHHVQCLVTATNAAGSATGHSAFVAIPRQGIVAAANETVVGRALAKGERVSVSIGCSPRAARGCAIALRLTTLRADRRRRLVATTVGSSATRLARGQRRTLTVSLDALGRRLLGHARHLSVRLSVSGTVIGILTASLSRQRVTLSRTPHGRRG